MMSSSHRWTPQVVKPRTLGRMFIGATALLGLTACTFDLDDPTGVRQRRAEERYAECQKISIITNAQDEQAVAAYQQGLATDGVQTREGLLAEAEVSLRAAGMLEALALKDENLQSLSLNLAARLRQMAEAKRAMAPFADVERTITSANDRSAVHQASVVQRDEVSSNYGGVLRALEAYCDGDELPPALESSIL
ncbi:MAG: hypothetical protein AAFR26_22815 [Cyanobacteria bacterium J06626_4]